MTIKLKADGGVSGAGDPITKISSADGSILVSGPETNTDIEVNYDNETIVKKAGTGKLSVPLSTNTLNIKPDNTIGVKYRSTSLLSTPQYGLQVSLDNNTLLPDANGIKVNVNPETLVVPDDASGIDVRVDPEALKVDAIKGIGVKYRATSLTTTSEFGLQVNYDDKSINTGIEGIQVKLNPDTLEVKSDTSGVGVKLSPNSLGISDQGGIGVKRADETIIAVERDGVPLGLAVNIDEETIKLGQHGLYAQGDGQGVRSVRADGTTIIVETIEAKNAVNADEVDVELKVNIDEETIIVDDEGWIGVNIDEDTLQLNADKKIEVPAVKQPNDNYSFTTTAAINSLLWDFPEVVNKTVNITYTGEDLSGYAEIKLPKVCKDLVINFDDKTMTGDFVVRISDGSNLTIRNLNINGPAKIVSSTPTVYDGKKGGMVRFETTSGSGWGFQTISVDACEAFISNDYDCQITAPTGPIFRATNGGKIYSYMNQLPEPVENTVYFSAFQFSELHIANYPHEIEDLTPENLGIAIGCTLIIEDYQLFPIPTSGGGGGGGGGGTPGITTITNTDNMLEITEGEGKTPRKPGEDPIFGATRYINVKKPTTPTVMQINSIDALNEYLDTFKLGHDGSVQILLGFVPTDDNYIDIKRHFSNILFQTSYGAINGVYHFRNYSGSSVSFSGFHGQQITLDIENSNNGIFNIDNSDFRTLKAKGGTVNINSSCLCTNDGTTDPFNANNCTIVSQAQFQTVPANGFFGAMLEKGAKLLMNAAGNLFGEVVSQDGTGYFAAAGHQRYPDVAVVPDVLVDNKSIKKDNSGYIYVNSVLTTTVNTTFAGLNQTFAGMSPLYVSDLMINIAQGTITGDYVIDIPIICPKITFLFNGSTITGKLQVKTRLSSVRVENVICDTLDCFGRSSELFDVSIVSAYKFYSTYCRMSISNTCTLRGTAATPFYADYLSFMSVRLASFPAPTAGITYCSASRGSILSLTSNPGDNYTASTGSGGMIIYGTKLKSPLP
jgi:hypothetical protein